MSICSKPIKNQRIEVIKLKILKSSKIIHIFSLISLTILGINFSFIAPLKAGHPLFHETFTTDPNDPYYTQHKIFISYEVYVWSNGHVEVYATYCCYNSDPNACEFEYLGVQTQIGITVNGSWTYGDNFPHHAPNQYREAYVDDLNPDAEYWSQGRPMYIDIQLCFNTFYLYPPYAVIQMVLFYRPLGAIGLLSSVYIVFTDHPVMYPPPYY